MSAASIASARALGRLFAPLVADPCPQCGLDDCFVPACERCDKRHGRHVVEASGTRLVCDECAALRDCDGCQRLMPRYQLTRIADAGSFCEGCCHVQPGAHW